MISFKGHNISYKELEKYFKEMKDNRKKREKI